MSSNLDPLLSLIAKLPGLGPRSAKRVLLHLLKHRERLMRPLAEQLATALDTIVACQECGNLDTHAVCHLCADPKRDRGLLCVVEDVSDLWAMERSSVYKGLYHVLGGTLSALEGRGPRELSMDALLTRAKRPEVREVILATNATVEGHTTAHYISDALLGGRAKITRLAQGIPFGGELDYLDEGTLGAALQARLPA